jgi:hypothetical protein
MMRASELRSSVTFKMGIYIFIVNHSVENISLDLLNKLKYQLPFKIPTKISDRFRAFPWPIQSNSEPEIVS